MNGIIEFFTMIATNFGIGWLLFTILLLFSLFFTFAFFFGIPNLKGGSLIEPYKSVSKLHKVIYADEKNKKDKIGYIIPIVSICHVYGKNWNTKDHQKFYDKIEIECKALKIKNFNVSEANITSKLITKMENIYHENGKLNVICLPDQKNLLNYLVLAEAVQLDILED